MLVHYPANVNVARVVRSVRCGPRVWAGAVAERRCRWCRRIAAQVSCDVPAADEKW